MKKDYQIYHHSHYENKDALINRLLEKIVSLEKEVGKLKEENGLLKLKYVSSLKNSIKEKANPFSVSLHKGEKNGFECNVERRQASTGYNNSSMKKSRRMNQTQANISMYLMTDVNDLLDKSDYKLGVNSSSNINNNTTSKKNRKVLSLSRSTFKVPVDVIDIKSDSFYLKTESESNNKKKDSIKTELMKQLRPYSTQQGLIPQAIRNKNNLLMNMRNNTPISSNTHNEKYQSVNSYSNTNTNSNNPSSQSFIYNKTISIPSERTQFGGGLQEKENQLIQINRRIFNKSPFSNKKYN